MNNIPKICIKRPVATIMFVLMIVVIGVYSLVRINMDLFPSIEYPAALVITRYDNAAPKEVEKLVTAPLEESLATVPGVKETQSLSMFGYSIIFQEFQMDSNLDFDTLAMREKISMVEKYLPDEIEKPMVLKLALDSLPIMQVYVSGDISQEELTKMTENGIEDYFKRAGGVAAVDIIGGQEKEIAIKLSEERLKGYGLTLAQISQLLMAENINLPGGKVRHGDGEVIVRSMGEFKSVEDINNVTVNLIDGSSVRLNEIANIDIEDKDRESAAFVNEKTSIGLMISKQSDANTVKISNAVKKQIKILEEKYPNLDFEIGYNQADFIEKSIGSVANSALIGSILAIAFVFLFLRNVRATLVIAISIPVSLLATFATMKYRGMTLNLITLTSLTIAVGMLVDNAIVVLENIFRLRQNNTARVASEKGSEEIFFAILSSTLTTVVVFLPIALSGGLTGLLFGDFCFTIIIALTTSLIVAMTATPMLCSLLLKKGVSQNFIRIGKHHYRYKALKRFAESIENLKEFYGNFMEKALKRPKKVLAICFLIFASSIVLVAFVGAELISQADEGSIKVTLEFPYGTSLEEKEKTMMNLSEIIAQNDEIVTRTINIGNIGFLGQETSEIQIKLKDKRKRDLSSEELAVKIYEQISDTPGVDITVAASSMMSSMMSGESDLEVAIKGNDLKIVEEIVKDIEETVKKVPHVVNVKSNIHEGNPELLLSLKRESAAYYGITTMNLANSVSNAVDGKRPTNLKINGNEMKIKVSLDDEYSESIESMKRITVKGLKGEDVPIGEIADFEFSNSPQSIARINQEECLYISWDYEGDKLGKSSKQILQYLKDYNYPPGFSYQLGGAGEEMQSAFSSLLLALLVAVALVYLILAAQFESVLLPFIVMMSIPFAMSGAFLLMFITDTRLSLVSFLGLIMLAGIVVNNAILLVEFIRQNESVMSKEKALIEAGKLRLRPILMSAGTTITGMVPMALGLGDGGEALAPLGVSIIGGLSASTVVTLVLIPVLYKLVDDKKQQMLKKQKEHDEYVLALEKKWEAEGI